jgi:hypothetical protein
MKKRVLQILLFILPMAFSLPVSATDNLCMDGTLLFREDFGGNDPEDPNCWRQQTRSGTGAKPVAL